MYAYVPPRTGALAFTADRLPDSLEPYKYIGEWVYVRKQRKSVSPRYRVRERERERERERGREGGRERERERGGGREGGRERERERERGRPT